ncbi:MAG: polysaccharide biosynthesis protein [Lachnospiraceae bacterium]|nr:polysaccharide biosynthesis protein [Lachnospiraceae bacterium]
MRIEDTIVKIREIYSKRKIYFRSMLSGLLLQAVMVIQGLVIPNMILKSYGSVLNGLISTVSQFINYLTFIEMGLMNAALIALYKPMGIRDFKTVNGVCAAVDRYYKKIAVYFTIGTFCIGIILPLFIKDDIPLVTIWLVLLALAGINLTTYLFTGKYHAILTAGNKVYVNNYTQLVGHILQIILSIYIIRSRWNIALVKVIVVLINLIEFVLLFSYCKKVFSKIHFKEKPLYSSIKQRKYILFHQICYLVTNGTDVILLTLFGNSLGIISIYSVFNMIGVLMTRVLQSVDSAIEPRMAQKYVMGEVVEVRRIFSRYKCGYDSLLFLLYACMAVLIIPFVRIYTRNVHDVSYDVPVIGLLFCITGLLYNYKIPFKVMNDANGYYKETRYIVVIEAVINIAVSLILLPKFNIIGVLTGTAVAEVIACVLQSLFFYRYIFKFRISETIIRIVLDMAIFIVVYRLSLPIRRLEFVSYMQFVCVGAAVFFTMAIIFAATNSVISIITDRIYKEERYKIL